MPLRQSQGGDPAGAAGWGGGLYFVEPGGIEKVSTGGAAGKGFTEEILNNFPCGEPRGGGVAPFLILEGFGAAERVGDEIWSRGGGKGRGVVLNAVRAVGG